MKKKGILIFTIFCIVVIIESGLFKRTSHWVMSFYFKNLNKNSININFSELNIPDNWYIQNETENYFFLKGPSWTWWSKQQYMTIFKNDESIKRNYFYMDPKFCIEASTTTLENKSIFSDNDSVRELSFPADILFCKKTIRDNEQYIGYFNKAFMTLIIIKPYQEKYRDNYIKLLESLQYKNQKNNLPIWLSKEIGTNQ